MRAISVNKWVDRYIVRVLSVLKPALPGEKEVCTCSFCRLFSSFEYCRDPRWRKMKKEWLDLPDYLTKEDLAYAISRCLANKGMLCFLYTNVH